MRFEKDIWLHEQSQAGKAGACRIPHVRMPRYVHVPLTHCHLDDHFDTFAHEHKKNWQKKEVERKKANARLSCISFRRAIEVKKKKKKESKRKERHVQGSKRRSRICVALQASAPFSVINNMQWL